MVVSVAEYFLRHEVRTVLDIGAGEGAWHAELKRLRPRSKYLGLDPSEYVVATRGPERNIRLGSFEDVGSLPKSRKYDLIVCADVLQYVPTPAVKIGLKQIARRLDGVAFLEAYTSGDNMEGDLEGWHQRSRRVYRALFDEAGLVGCGLHCYMRPTLAENAVELELAL